MASTKKVKTVIKINNKGISHTAFFLNEDNTFLKSKDNGTCKCSAANAIAFSKFGVCRI